MRPRRTRWRVSEHFVIEEFDSGDGAQVRKADHGAILHLVEWWLEPMRDVFGAVTVHSGYRSYAHNIAVGGARGSVHLLTTALPAHHGRAYVKAAAADVSCAEGTPGRWARWARTHRRASSHLHGHGRGGIGSYPTFVHLDTSGEREWQP